MQWHTGRGKELPQGSHNGISHHHGRPTQAFGSYFKIWVGLHQNLPPCVWKGVSAITWIVEALLKFLLWKSSKSFYPHFRETNFLNAAPPIIPKLANILPQRKPLDDNASGDWIIILSDSDHQREIFEVFKTNRKCWSTQQRIWKAISALAHYLPGLLCPTHTMF